MERDWIEYGLIALGGVVLWLIYRRPGTGMRGRMVLVACAVAIAITYALLFQFWEP